MNLSETISPAFKTFLQENGKAGNAKYIRSESDLCLPAESMLPSFFVVSQVSLADLGDATVFTKRNADLGKDGMLEITCGPATLCKCPRCWLHTREDSEKLCERCTRVLAE